MKSTHTTIRKALLLVVPAVLLAFVLQPVVAVAWDTATVTYETDGHGTVTPESTETVLQSYPVYDSSDWIEVGYVGDVTADSTERYEFDYWTADKVVYIGIEGSPYYMKAIPIGAEITDALSSGYGYYIAEDTTFTAHFKRTAPYTITYETDGNGTVDPTTEEVTNAFDNPQGSTPSAKEGFEFGCWTANVDVVLGTEEPLTITAGNPITTEQLKQVIVTDDITFTAHFAEKDVDPDPDPVDPDDSDDKTVKPASDKPVPKTGDTLPGAVAAVALGAGAIVAGAALLKKRFQ